MSFRNKVVNHSQVFQPDLINSSFDQSRADSIASKRFTRKKQSSHESGRNHKIIKKDQSAINCIEKSPSQALFKHRIKLSDPLIRAQDLFLKISNTPSKTNLLASNINSDRTETTVPMEQGENQGNTFIFNKETKKKINVNELRTQIEIKSNELMVLQDENMCLKRDLKLKQQQFLKQKRKKETEYYQTINQLQSQIKRLRQQLAEKNEELRTKNQEIKNYKKNEQQLLRDIKSARYDKLMMQKQMQELYKKKLTKETRQLMSFREMSLMKQLDQIKIKLAESKTQLQAKLQEQVNQLREDNDAINKKNQSCTILNLILHKKIEEVEKQLKEKTESFGKVYTQMVQSNRELTDQLAKAKKQVVRLRQLNMSKATGVVRRKNLVTSSQQSDSLSFSFSN